MLDEVTAKFNIEVSRNGIVRIMKGVLNIFLKVEMVRL